VIDVEGGDGVAELAERVVEAGRVGAAGDEAQHLAARLDQVVPADVLVDGPEQIQASIQSGLLAGVARGLACGPARHEEDGGECEQALQKRRLR
jgi:hypothetical protein